LPGTGWPKAVSDERRANTLRDEAPGAYKDIGA
jgi:hypothetical protein